MENFKPIPEYEGKYEISDEGIVVSLLYGKRRTIKPWKTKHGYMMVRLTQGNQKTRCRTVHLLVAAAFMGHCSDGTQSLVVDHYDNNKSNNRLSNLRLISQRENASKHGVKGYSLHKKSGLFFSRIYINRKHVLLGYFKTPEEAKQAYKKALNDLQTKNEL